MGYPNNRQPLTTIFNSLKFCFILGYGVFATETIGHGEPLLEYKGERFSLQCAEERRQHHTSHGKPDCFIFEYNLSGNVFW